MAEMPGVYRWAGEELDDPYAEASLAPGNLPEARWGPRRPAMKRKVLRHRPDGGMEVWDESVLESEAESWSSGRDWLQEAESSISEGELDVSSNSFEESGSRFLGELGSGSSPSSQNGALKSFIPPRLGRDRTKTDPVAKYFEYKRDWERFCIPGEDRRQELRRGVHEQMLCAPQPPSRTPLPRRPNGYTVPTEKKRAALRWGVRCDLAQGLLPRRTTSSWPHDGCCGALQPPFPPK